MCSMFVNPENMKQHILTFADSKPLDYINDWTTAINPQETYYIHCAGGYRSMIAASILKARGVDQVINIEGGYSAMKNNVPN